MHSGSNIFIWERGRKRWERENRRNKNDTKGKVEAETVNYKLTSLIGCNLSMLGFTEV